MLVWFDFGVASSLGRALILSNTSFELCNNVYRASPQLLPTTYLVYYAIGRGGECMLGVTCWLIVLRWPYRDDMEGYHFIMRVVSFES